MAVWGRSALPRRGLGALALTSGLVLAAVSCCGSGGGGGELTVDGAKLTDPEGLLAAAAAQMRTTDPDAPASFSDASRCYFLSNGPGGQVGRQLACGPVVRQFGDSGRPFDFYDFSVTVDGEGAAVWVLAPERAATGMAARALAADEIMFLPDVSGAEETAVSDVVLESLTWTFAQRGFSTPQSVGANTSARRAAGGQELFAARFEMRYRYFEEHYSNVPERAAFRATLLVDGRRFDVRRCV